MEKYRSDEQVNSLRLQGISQLTPCRLILSHRTILPRIAPRCGGRQVMGIKLSCPLPLEVVLSVHRWDITPTPRLPGSIDMGSLGYVPPCFCRLKAVFPPVFSTSRHALKSLAQAWPLPSSMAPILLCVRQPQDCSMYCWP